MTAEEKIAALKSVLKGQLVLYREYVAKEESGEIDGSYVYDMAPEWFERASHVIYANILGILES